MCVTCVDKDLDGNGMHTDVHVMDINNESDKPEVKKKHNATADIKHFFKAVPHLPGSKSGQMRCESCLYAFFLLLFVQLLD